MVTDADTSVPGQRHRHCVPGALAAGGQGQNRNLASRLSQLDEQVGRQQELLYSVDFQLQEMGRRVARAKGVRSDEETKQLNLRIQQLASLLEGVNGEHLMLLEQVRQGEGEEMTAAGWPEAAESYALY